MDVVSSNYLPGDPRLIDHIVYELKSQGIFDNFRKECIADVDTKPAYQNLRQRVEGSVIGFLKTQRWRPDMNKNQVREMLRKNISESGFLETGVERIVDQVVNPKINSIFLPQVENVVYKVLGIQKPSTFDELKAQTDSRYPNNSEKLDMSGSNLLPSDLETVSPESEPHERKLDISSELQKLDSSKIDEDESPPFEPLEEATSFMMQEENSVDSHLSGFSGLASHDSNHSFEVANKITPMEISNQDSQFSKQSSDDRLSIVMSDETETKMEINEDSSQSKISKVTDSNSKSFDFMQDQHASSDKSSQSSIKQDKIDFSKKIEKSKGDDKKAEKYRNSDKRKPRHDSKSESRDRKNEKDRKSDRDKKEYRDKSKHSTKDREKERKDSRSKSGKDEKDSESKSDKEHKHEKDRDRNKSYGSKHSSSKDKSSSEKDSAESKTKEKPKESSESKDLKTKEFEHRKSKTKESEHKELKTKESEHKDSKTKDSSAHKGVRIKDGKEKRDGSKTRDDSKSKSETKSHNSSKNRGDSKSHSKYNEKAKTGSSEVDKSSSKLSKKDDRSYKKEDKHHTRNEKYSSSSKKDGNHDKDKKDLKKDVKKVSKDDHYSLKGKNSNRRSTDRDSSDGHSGTHSSSSSFGESSSSQIQKSSQDNSRINSRSDSGDSGNSDQVDEIVLSTAVSIIPEIQEIISENREQVTAEVTSIPQLPQVKLIKPKFASNIFEARRLMKIRKKLGKIEKRNQMELINTGVTLKSSSAPLVKESDSVVTYEIVTVENEPDTPDNNENLRRRPNILKKPASTTGKLNLLSSKWNLNRGLKANTTQFLKHKVKASNHHRKSDENLKNASEELEVYVEKKVESEEENVAKIMEISDVDDSVSNPLQNSVISKESWDAVEAKLVENVMKVDYNSYSDSLLTIDKKEICAVQPENVVEGMENENCLCLCPDLPAETQRYLVAVRLLTAQLEETITKKEMLLKMSQTQKQTTAINADTVMEIDGVHKRLPKVAIVDVTNDSEIIISPSRGMKRYVSDHPDIHNNNKRSSQLEEDQVNEKLNHTKLNPSTKPSFPSRPKKAKNIDNTVNHLDTFSLPLSPAESDKSFTTTSDKKYERDDAKVKRNSNINKAANNFCNQRYSTDDLYKPRLQFSSSRRRAARGRDKN